MTNPNSTLSLAKILIDKWKQVLAEASSESDEEYRKVVESVLPDIFQVLNLLFQKFETLKDLIAEEMEKPE